MSITAAKSATTPIPVQLSETEFTAFIFPHLSMPKRGPKCKLGYHRVFNLILWVLYTGMQWKCLPGRGSNQGNTQKQKSLYHQGFIDFRCYPEMALFEPRQPFAYKRTPAPLKSAKVQINTMARYS